MKELYKLKEMAMKELGEIVKEGEFNTGTLDVAQKLTDVIKNVDKICLLEEEGEDDYSREGSYRRGRYSRDGYSEDGDSYARRGMHYVRGHYSRDGGGSSYDSYEGGNSSRRGYSRDGGKEKVRGMIEEMMGEAGNERSRESYRRIMEELEHM